MQGRVGMKRIGVCTIVLVLLALSSSAFAAPKPAGYGGSAGNVQSAVGPVKPAGAVLGATTSGQLPFTGMELVVFTAAGLLMIGAGASMRRVSRRQRQ